MIALHNITAAILAGGKSSRMGTDKALLKIGDAAFIERIARTARSVFERVILISDANEKYSSLPLPIYLDLFPQCGPLGGLHSALVHSSTPYVFVTPCDLPLITAAMIQELVGKACEVAITIVSDGAHTQPLFGIYPISLQSHIEQALHSGTRSLFNFLSGKEVEVLDFSHYKHELCNINTQEEWREVVEKNDRQSV